MKTINNYILEKLTLGKHIHEYKPQNKLELIKILDEVLKESGVDADLNCIDTSEMTDMSGLFFGKDIRNIDISKWDVNNVTHSDYAFSNSGIKI